MVCERCGGFKVHDYFYGATDYFAWQCLGFRCINCGAISHIQPIDTNEPRSRRDTSHSRTRQTAHHPRTRPTAVAQ